jgi:hypothetical protein
MVPTSIRDSPSHGIFETLTSCNLRQDGQLTVCVAEAMPLSGPPEDTARYPQEGQLNEKACPTETIMTGCLTRLTLCALKRNLDSYRKLRERDASQDTIAHYLETDSPASNRIGTPLSCSRRLLRCKRPRKQSDSGPGETRYLVHSVRPQYWGPGHAAAT